MSKQSITRKLMQRRAKNIRDRRLRGLTPRGLTRAQKDLRMFRHNLFLLPTARQKSLEKLKEENPAGYWWLVASEGIKR